MKQTRLILIGILSGIIILLIVVLMWGIQKGSLIDFGQEAMGAYDVVSERKIPVAEIEKLQLLFDKNSYDVYFYESDSEEIVLREYANKNLPEEKKIEVQKKDEVLTVKSRNKSVFSFGWFSLGSWRGNGGYVEVYLPASYAASVEVVTVSGDIVAKVDFLLKEDAHIKASSTSGDVTLLAVEAETVDISTVSGDIMAEAVRGETQCSTTSGDISITDGVGDVDFNTVSGDVDFEKWQGNVSVSTTSGYVNGEKITGGVKASTVSGDVELFFDNLTSDIKVSTTSGYVELAFDEDACVAFEADTTSGDIATFFDEVLSYNKKGNQADGNYGQGERSRVTVSTVSGDVEVRAN